MGALRHTLERARRGHWSVGAYSGLSGALYSTVTVFKALHHEELVLSAVKLIEKLAEFPPASQDVDIIGGRAGAIRALLFASRAKVGDAGRALHTATRFGRELIDRAHKRGDEWSWDTVSAPVKGHLVGYAHGTSGIACALDDLFRATRMPEFHEAASCAFRYEQAHFDHAAENWPDLRLDTALQPKEEKKDRFMCAWCSGAPGTALALARRIATSPDSVLEGLLEASLRTIVTSIRIPDGNEESRSFCLCHGVAGNADVLVEIEGLLGRADLSELINAVARHGLAKYHDSGLWPCGVSGTGEAPGLLLGLAGIGHFYLRLHDRRVPSPLLL
jgi:lantibiotic modifying enzyme